MLLSASPSFAAQSFRNQGQNAALVEAAGQGQSVLPGAQVPQAPAPFPVFGPESEEDVSSQSETGQAPLPGSEKPDYISGAVPSEITDQLPRFGYSFFKGAPSTFAPVQEVPVGPEYVLGPGDTLQVLIWGMFEGNWSVPVDRNGNIALPQAGILGVAGLTFGQAQEAIRKAYERYYTNFEINVTMGNLRSITVYVVGQVDRPGAYTVSALSTLVNALMGAGGPSYAGTLRDIQVKRAGKVITHFDAYNLLLKGEKKGDVRLMPGDVIFVPPVANLVGITGDIKNPAYYEFTGKMRLRDLVKLAGGFTSRYFQGRVQVDRTEGHAFRTAFESDLKGLGDLRKNFMLANGDLVKVFPVSEKPSIVKVSGSVAQPGDYAIRPGFTRLRDILQRAGGLLDMAAEQAEVTRVTITQQGPVTEHLPVDLAGALRGDASQNILLQKNDYLVVHNVPEWDLYKVVTLEGEVVRPGDYALRKGERLSDLLERAGGFTSAAFLSGSRFTRESVRERQQKRIVEMTERLEQNLYSASAAAAGTSMTAADAQAVAVETQQKQKLLDRLREVKPEGRVVVRIPDDYRLLKGSPYDMELEEGDHLVIPREPQTVGVIGAVFSPTAFVYRPGESFLGYIKQAGSYSTNADRKRVYIVKADGSSIRAYKGKKPVSPENGDTVVVPEKVDVKSKLRDTRDIIDIIYKVAISAAVVLD